MNIEDVVVVGNTCISKTCSRSAQVTNESMFRRILIWERSVTHRHTKMVSPYGAASLPPRSPSLHRRPPCIGNPKIWSAGGFHQALQGVVSQPTRLQIEPICARPGTSVGVSICSSGGFLAYCVQYFRSRDGIQNNGQENSKSGDQI
jgi:hypothetical protein